MMDGQGGLSMGERGVSQGEHHHPAWVSHHPTHPSHLLKAALSALGDYRGLVDKPDIYLPTYRTYVST